MMGPKKEERMKWFKGQQIKPVEPTHYYMDLHPNSRAVIDSVHWDENSSHTFGIKFLHQDGRYYAHQWGNPEDWELVQDISQEEKLKQRVQYESDQAIAKIKAAQSRFLSSFHKCGCGEVATWSSGKVWYCDNHSYEDW